MRGGSWLDWLPKPERVLVLQVAAHKLAPPIAFVLSFPSGSPTTFLDRIRREFRQTISEIAPKSCKRTAVRCLDVYTATERLISFLVDEQEIEVRTILESWREPEYLCFV